jgi:hypothetical protein
MLSADFFIPIAKLSLSIFSTSRIIDYLPESGRKLPAFRATNPAHQGLQSGKSARQSVPLTAPA